MATVPAPKTWSVNEDLTAAGLNLELRDAANFLLNPPRVRVTHSATQSAANSTYTAHPFNTEVYDTDAIHSTSVNTSRLTIVTPGVYRLSGAISWAGNATGRRYQTWYLNGAVIDGGALHLPASSASNITLPAATIDIACIAGDYIELFGLQDSGGALNMNPGSGFWSYAQALWVSK